MKRLFLILVTFAMTILGYAQKTTIAVGKIDRATSVSSNWASILKQSMMMGLGKSVRINLFDADNLSNLSGSSQDRLVQMKEEYHVDYLITATMTSLTYKYSTTKDGKPWYEATMEYTTTVTDAGNGETVKVSAEKHFGHSSKNSDAAYMDSFDLVSLDMKELIEECFPLVGTIQMVDESHAKKGAKTVFVDLGSDLGMEAGTYLDVFKIREMAGREIPTNIGTLRCKEVVAEDLSICTVKKGGVEIQKALDNEEKLIVKTRKSTLLEL